MADGDLSDIEARVARDRDALARSLDALASTLAPDRLKGEAEGYGRELSGQLWGAARENPAAFALMGAGLALMLTNATRRPETDGIEPERPGPKAVPAHEAMAGFDERVAAADARIRAEREKDARRELRAARLRSAVNSGLERLPPAARARVLDARRRAIAAQDEVERRASRAAAKAARIASDQPVAVAAAAFGVGALIAAVLPSTEREDALMGAERDRLMDEAQRALSRELDALRAPGGNGSTAATASPAAAPSGQVASAAP